MKTYELVIERDDNAESPREWDNVGTLAAYHKDYDFNESEFDSYEAKALTEDTDYLTLPVYMYDHSGLSVRTSPFSCRWDSGQLGIIYVSREKARKEWGDIPDEKIFEYLDGEVKVWNQYLSGDVHSIAIQDDEGNLVESCCGFFGWAYAQTEGEEMLQRVIKTETGRAAQEEADINMAYANL